MSNAADKPIPHRSSRCAPFRCGDRVKLTASVAKTFSRGGKTDIWSTRAGTVTCVNVRLNHVRITWDGRTAADFWPIQALELA